MREYRVVPASIRHVRPMARHMRLTGSVALMDYGFEQRRALHRTFMASIYCRTALVDERPVAMWGVVGTILGDEGYVWLIISDDIRDMPRAILKEARAELRKISERFSELTAVILPKDVDSVRFARHLGFGGEEEGDDPFTDERYHVPLGDSHAVRVVYRQKVNA